jgi:hypothetical protein
MLSYKRNLGTKLKESFERFIDITSQNSPCCSVVHVINQLGPELTIRYMDSVIKAIKGTPEYIAYGNRISDRLLILFVRSVIRKSLLDIQATPVTIYLPPFKKGSNDATRTRKITCGNLQECTQGNDERETAEPSRCNCHE